MIYAVIDISSSSISMVVCEGNNGLYNAIAKERAHLALYNYIENGMLTDRGIDKLVSEINTFKLKCRNYGAQKCYCIATAIMRYLKNSEQVAASLLERAGVSVNEISGDEEARCDYLSNKKYAAYDRAVLIDIGGASVELCGFTADEPELCSLSVGALSLANKFVDKIYPDGNESDKIKKHIDKTLDKAKLPKKGTYQTTVLVGATVAAIYDIYADYFAVKDLGDKTVSTKKLKKLSKYLVTSSDRSRLILKIAPERVHTVITGTLILNRLLKRFDVANIIFSENGVKEGFLTLVNSGEYKAVEFDPNSEISRTLTQTTAPLSVKLNGKSKESAKTEKTKANKAESGTTEKSKANKAESGTTEKAKSNKAESGTSEKTKANKAESGTSEKAKANKAESGTSEKAKSNKTESGTSEKAKANKVESGTSEKAKANKTNNGATEN